MMLERNITVGQVAAGLPKSMDYFKEIGVDYCCGGNRTLVEVLKAKGLAEDEVFARLDELEQQASAQNQRQDFQAMSPQALCDYIVETHHVYLRRVMPEIGHLLNAVMRAHGAQHRELFKVGQLFGHLRGDLEQHLMREELFLFPALLSPHSGEDAAALTPELIGEHEEAGEILAHLRATTCDYAIPGDACVTYEKVYHMLDEMEDDLHRHIHLENNILLRKYDIR